MSSDLWALVATIGLAVVQIGMASILTLRQLGPAYVLSPRDEPREVEGISGRIVRAHRNLLEIFPQFVAALFVVHVAGVAAELSVYGSWLFFAARLAYVPAYAVGPVGVRPVCWMAGQIGILMILADLLVLLR